MNEVTYVTLAVKVVSRQIPQFNCRVGLFLKSTLLHKTGLILFSEKLLLLFTLRMELFSAKYAVLNKAAKLIIAILQQ